MGSSLRSAVVAMIEIEIEIGIAIEIEEIWDLDTKNVTSIVLRQAM